MDAKTRTVLTRAGTTLIVAGVIVLAALVVNAPSTVRVEFDVACRSFVLPAATKLDLNRLPTQITSGTFYGFGGALAGHGLAVSNVEDPSAPKPIPLAGQLHHLTPTAVAPLPYVKVTPGGAIGLAEAALEAGVILSATADGALVAEAPRARAIRVSLQSNRQDFEAERYAPRALLAVAPAPGVMTTLQALPLPDGRARLDLRFVPGPREVALLDGVVPLPAGSGGITFRAARAVVVTADGRGLDSLERDRELDLTAGGDEGAITGVGLVLNPKDPDAPRVHIVGWVSTNSVRQGGAELLPTWLEETLDTSGLGRSLWITVLGLVAFVLFKAVNSALDALLKLWIGE